MPDEMMPLDCTSPIWDRFYLVAPLVLVGTTEPDGSLDLAVKHMAGPVSWENHWAFSCSPDHATYLNVQRTGVFTVSYPRPDQIVQVSLTTAPRAENGEKPALEAIETVPAIAVEGAHLQGAQLMLECEYERVVDELGPNSIIVGRVVAAQVSPNARRGPDRDGADVIADSPLLVYLQPDRVATVDSGRSFPFHAGWKR